MYTVDIYIHFIMKTLYLASGSASRKMLLTQADIPFVVCSHDAHEESISLQQSIEQVVTQIAQLKMQHAQIPHGMYEGEMCFVLTADTMGRLHDGKIVGKPSSYEELCDYLSAYQFGSTTGTAVCIERRVWRNHAWHLEDAVCGYAQATYRFAVPLPWLDRYIEAVQRLDNVDPFNVSGGVTVEGYGAQFLTDIEGDYTAIVGLPMFLTRELLTKLEFWD